MKLELYGSYTSPFVRHCRIALIETGLDFTLIETDQQQSDKLVNTKKVPFFDICDEAGQTMRLSDSSSILRFIREKAGQSFMPTLLDLENFCFINTQQDTGANVFYLEKFGINTENNAYIVRQHSRIQQGLKSLNDMNISFKENDDVSIRLACYLDWGLFRQRFTLDAYPNLQHILTSANTYAPFQQTPPTE